MTPSTERSGSDAPGFAAAQATGSVPGLLWKALRPYQWSKNVLLFLPLFCSHQFTDPHKWRNLLMALLIFNLAASAGYLVNDFLDRRDDRLHYRKRLRPFASGRLPLAWAWAAPALSAAALGLCWWLPTSCVWFVLLYLAVTVAYSAFLKRYAIFDVIILACLYCLRLAMGAAASEITISLWLMSFAVFLFLTLALSKRAAELKMWQQLGERQSFGRGYTVDDLPVILALGAGAGYISALVLLLYLQSPDVTRYYRHPQYLWLVLPLLLAWVSRLWLLAYRGNLTEDPIVFALQDRASLLLGVTTAAIVLTAI